MLRSGEITYLCDAKSMFFDAWNSDNYRQELLNLAHYWLEKEGSRRFATCIIGPNNDLLSDRPATSRSRQPQPPAPADRPLFSFRASSTWLPERHWTAQHAMVRILFVQWVIDNHGVIFPPAIDPRAFRRTESRLAQIHGRRLKKMFFRELGFVCAAIIGVSDLLS